MRLKARPEDFVVREAAGLRIRRQPAPFRVYMLEKRGWNTADALMRISREKRVPYSRFAYGGKKDRHAHTFQYVTVQAPVDLTHETKGYSFKWLGYSEEAMTAGLITANHFELTLRELSAAEAARVETGLSRVRELGVPNYFDDQRFGNLDRERGFVAERLLQGRWEEALQIALTAIYPEEQREAKERKRALRERWGDWNACRELAKSAFEQRCFAILGERPEGFREALATVNRENSEMWVSTYQSFLFNEVLRRLIAARGWGAGAVPGAAGSYLFTGPAARLEGLVIPLAGPSMRFSDPESCLLFEEVLRERRLRPSSFEAEVVPGLRFRASPRPALLKPPSLWAE